MEVVILWIVNYIPKKNTVRHRSVLKSCYKKILLFNFVFHNLNVQKTYDFTMQICSMCCKNLLIANSFSDRVVPTHKTDASDT